MIKTKCTRYLFYITSSIFFLFTSAELNAQEFGHLTWSSSNKATTLVELYTSEGCSSCPPAERWMNSLVKHPRLFKDLIPLAFHVDYWNYLGWEDRFAKDANSHRQRVLHRQGIFSGVYTPGVAAASREWHGWRRQSAIPTSDQSPGILQATITDGLATISFQHTGQYKLHIVYLGMGLHTAVKSGENRNRSLSHEFVVLKHWQEPGNGHWKIELPKIPDMQPNSVALAIWLTAKHSERVIQAVGGYL